MSSEQALSELTINRVEQLYSIAEQRLSRRFPRPIIQLNGRGKAAGVAYLQQNRLKFNPVLFAQNKQAFIDEVIPHEISHLIAYHLFGKVKPHGKEWQSIMVEIFSVTPRTTHNFDTSSLKRRTFCYQCDCREVELSINRHNKVLRGQRYQCKHCQQILTFKYEKTN